MVAAFNLDSLHSRLRKFVSFAAFTAMSVSVAVLAGWGTGAAPWLLAISPRFVTMKPLTAAGFFLSGLSLQLVANERSLTAVRRHCSLGLAFCVALIGAGTTIEFISGLDLHFENTLFRQALLATPIPHPGRLSFATGVAFLLLGVALCLLDCNPARQFQPAQFLSVFVVLLATLHFLGYLYGAADLYRVFHQNTMAVHTATLFLLLALGVISARPDRGFAAVFNGPGIGGLMARRLLPSAVLLTVLIGWLRLMGERFGLYGTGFGLAVFACSNIAMFSILVAWAAHSLNLFTAKLDAASLNLARSDERVTQTNTLLAAIVESSEDAIITKSLDGIITSWNIGAVRIFGYTPNEAIGQPMHMLFPPERRPEEANILRRIAAGQSVDHFESTRIRKDGTPILISATVSPLRDSSGAIVGASQIARDITQQRRVELAVSEAQARLSAIIGSAMDAIVTVDEHQCITMFNPSAERMFACSASEAIGSSLDRFIPERFRQEHAANVRAFGKNDIPSRAMGRRGSIFARRSDGQEFPVEASISHATFDGRKLFTVILRDVTERHRAEEELRLNSRLLDLAPVLVCDLQNRILLWTRGAQKLFGFSSEEAVGRISNELLQTEFQAPSTEIEEALRRDGFWDGELVHKARDGRSVVVASNLVLHFDPQGQPTRILKINSDLTELKRSQKSQVRSQKLESLGTLAGGVAHDFNNILTAINGNSKLAALDLPSDHPIQRNLSEIAKAGARATDLVRRILAFSRPQEQQREPHAISPVVQEALTLVRATIPATIQIQTSFEPNLPSVSLDTSQIHQIIVNLATNAAHAIGHKPGTVTVRLSHRAVTRNDCLLSPDLHEGPYVVLSVTDTGCGMDRATLDRVFDPFFTTKPVGQGTGLGLSIVHGIMSSYDGAVTIYSQPGEGTSFSLYFPALAAHVPEEAAVTPSPSRSLHHEHILYVDDEEGLVTLGTLLLQRLGYQVVGHLDATVALKDFSSRPDFFAAAVTDLSMPRMSGFELARQLLAIRPNLPILMASGFVRAEDQKAAEALGIRRIILKPSTVDVLGSALSDILHSSPTSS